MTTTPLEREILTHYSTAAGPYRGGPHNWTETHVQIVRRFIDLGLLISDKATEGLQRIRPNEEALRVYMAALAAVPLPVQRWVVPSAQEAKSSSISTERRLESHNGGGPQSALATDDETQARVAELERQVGALQTEASRPRRARYEAEED